MKEIHPDLLKKLAETKDNYEKVTSFAKLLPMFASEIIKYEHTGSMYCCLAERYKQLYLSWGINWHISRPNNFPEDQPCELGLVGVYVNALSLFHKDLYDAACREINVAMKDVPCYYVDDLSSTYYFKPHEVEVGLEALNNWYIKLKENGQTYLKEKKRGRLLAELSQLDE